jgi:hypothetical protein
MSSWTDHIKRWAKANGTTYACALSDPKCRADYSKGRSAPAEKKAPAEKRAKNPLKGRVSRKLYTKAEDAREALSAFKAYKEPSRSAEPMDFGLSPSAINYVPF